MKSLLNRVLLPQIEAAERSFNITGKYGVWQVVDEPGAGGNFIEASASCMTAYSFLRAVRVASLDGLCDESIAKRSTTTAVGIYENILESFLEVGSNGTLSLNGTSTVASLSGDVSYEVNSHLLNNTEAPLADLLATVLCQPTDRLKRSFRDECIRFGWLGGRENVSRNWLSTVQSHCAIWPLAVMGLLAHMGGTPALPSSSVSSVSPLRSQIVSGFDLPLSCTKCTYQAEANPTSQDRRFRGNIVPFSSFLFRPLRVPLLPTLTASIDSIRTGAWTAFGCPPAM